MQEDPKSTLYFAHLFFADHILSTSWTIFFAVVWWLYSPHDGRRVSNSAAQDNIIENYLGETEEVSEEERARLALQLWRREKGVAIAIIVVGWLIKVSWRNLVRRLLYPSLSDFFLIVLSCSNHLLLCDSPKKGNLS